jgi:hypothetical protein
MAGQGARRLLKPHCFQSARLRHLKRRRVDGRIAQLVEQLTLNQRVHGSSPCAPTIENNYLSQIQPRFLRAIMRGASMGLQGRSDMHEQKAQVAAAIAARSSRVLTKSLTFIASTYRQWPNSPLRITLRPTTGAAQ